MNVPSKMSLFYSYSHADEELRDRLESHLASLRHEGYIDEWHKRKVIPGDELDGEISKHLERADRCAGLNHRPRPGIGRRLPGPCYHPACALPPLWRLPGPAVRGRGLLD